MSARLFKSIPDGVRATESDMAYNLAMEMIEGIKARRLEAKQAELACEESTPWTPADQERIDTLEALLKGKHRPIVVACILEHFPEMLANLPQA